ncbi:MAG: hypothetical protein PHZ07_04925 [Patescibacteria group bacterium]|nr:hypothetical protein [Patescibacteria group bacterium]MDD4304710.1 hypothetical protein [Patescibacteria group bacterium]MDD4695728.1 hypothetical protein [Patescibacteria group bacterium]
MKSLIMSMLLILVVSSLFIISCKNTTNLQNDWQPKPEAIQAKTTFETLPVLLQGYSLDNPSVFTQIKVEADSSNLYHSQNLTVRYLGTIIYEETDAEYGYEIKYGYFGNNNILIIASLHSYYSPYSDEWKCFINGQDQDEIFLNQPVSYITAPPNDEENPTQDFVKQLRIPEIRYSENRQVLMLKFNLFQSFHLSQWYASYWAEYNLTSLFQFGVDAWHLVE